MGEVIVFPARFDTAGKVWEPLVTEQSVARHFSVDPRTVRRWRALGCPSVRVSGSRRYRLSEVEQWHERRAS